MRFFKLLSESSLAVIREVRHSNAVRRKERRRKSGKRFDRRNQNGFA